MERAKSQFIMKKLVCSSPTQCSPQLPNCPTAQLSQLSCFCFSNSPPSSPDSPCNHVVSRLSRPFAANTLRRAACSPQCTPSWIHAAPIQCRVAVDSSPTSSAFAVRGSWRRGGGDKRGEGREEGIWRQTSTTDLDYRHQNKDLCLCSLEPTPSSTSLPLL